MIVHIVPIVHPHALQSEAAENIMAHAGIKGPRYTGQAIYISVPYVYGMLQPAQSFAELYSRIWVSQTVLIS